jgi:hypothetical protein
MNTTPINGAQLAMEIYKAVRESSQDIEAASREASHDAAEEELEHGLARAEEMHQQADAIRTGALVSGAITAVGGATTAIVAFDGLDEAWGKAAETLPSLGAAAGKYFEAAAQHHAADAEAHAARARAAGHRVDENATQAGTARDLSRSAQGLARSMGDTTHESMRAALSQRA